MKRILITGKDSYIGTAFEKWVKQWPEEYDVTTIDTMTNQWKQMDFSKYDVIFHVAAIVHKKEKPEMEALYMKVNCELPIQIAEKAKVEGIKQFIFMSSMSVYGVNSGIINKHTIPSPKTYYGKSKLEAEKALQSFETEEFGVSIIRPPMVYGENCKGNYVRLSHFAQKCPIFPEIKNYRSMIFIDNLCEAIRLIIENQQKGFFFPQNKEYVNTTILVQNIAKVHDKKLKTTSIFNFLLKRSIKRCKIIGKVFGNLVYKKDISDGENLKYCVVDFEESIRRTENKK